jgi:hypothetical protein
MSLPLAGRSVILAGLFSGKTEHPEAESAASLSAGLYRMAAATSPAPNWTSTATPTARATTV